MKWNHTSFNSGLLAATDDQTFSMALPSKLRNYYDKVVTPATSMGPGASAGPRWFSVTRLDYNGT